MNKTILDKPILLDRCPHYPGKTTYMINEIIPKVKARDTITDQHNKTRIVEDKEYILINENDETYLIIDEYNEKVRLRKEHFYYMSDN